MAESLLVRITESQFADDAAVYAVLVLSLRE